MARAAAHHCIANHPDSHIAPQQSLIGQRTFRGPYRLAGPIPAPESRPLGGQIEATEK